MNAKTRRQMVFGGIFLFLFGVAFLLIISFRQKTDILHEVIKQDEVGAAEGIRINPKTNRCIKQGMSEAEVVRILGGPPGDYFSKPIVFIDVAASLGWHNRDTWWKGDEFAIAVRFDDQGKVTESRCLEVYPDTGCDAPPI